MPFDHLTRRAVHDFCSFARLSGCAYSPLRFDEFGRSDAATRMLKMEHRATFHPRGLGGIPSTEAQSAPSPNVSCLV